MRIPLLAYLLLLLIALPAIAAPIQPGAVEVQDGNPGRGGGAGWIVLALMICRAEAARYVLRLAGAMAELGIRWRR
jgi:hypothetical protein